MVLRLALEARVSFADASTLFAAAARFRQCAPTFPGVVSQKISIAATSALLLGAVSALALADAGDGTAPSKERVVPSVLPDLRDVGALDAPEGQIDSGAGIYPALTAPARLAFPSRPAIDSARRFSRGRRGTVAFAIADERGGVGGLDADRPFASASLTKAMILVAYLRRSSAEGRAPSEADRTSLGYMIRLSDNSSADRMYARTGDVALRDLARRAGMRHFRIDGDWANASLTAADQARFFLLADRLVPPTEQRYARSLLETVSPEHSWGIPVAARPRWRVFFKGGWRPEGDGELVHQAALLERGPRRVSIAVMTDENPLMTYGEESIEGVARRLLQTPPAGLLTSERVVPGRLAPLPALENYEPPEPRRLLDLEDTQ